MERPDRNRRTGGLRALPSDAAAKLYHVGHEGRPDHYDRLPRRGRQTADGRSLAVFKVNMMLADAAQVAAGKLSLLGGGWSMIVPGGPFAVCGIIDIPWHQGTDWHTLRLELIDADGEPVLVPGPNGDEPLVFEPPRHRSTIGPHVKPGTSLGWPFALTVGPGLPLEPGAMYEWRLTIDGKHEEGWSLAFSVLPPSSLPKAA